MKIVFVNGCFDILHRGHLELFSYAKSLGDRLIVAIDSDEKVKRAKGDDRPFNNVADRKYFLLCLRSVDEVKIFNSAKELESLTKEISPDIMVVGTDWLGKHIVGGEHAREIKYFDRIDDYSTTKIIESISDR
jgi:D-beta-D-heptose 7-phosphate kinase/D-beta-D-heptose 1-phosphate adenosyltransferase